MDRIGLAKIRGIGAGRKAKAVIYGLPWVLIPLAACGGDDDAAEGTMQSALAAQLDCDPELPDFSEINLLINDGHFLAPLVRPDERQRLAPADGEATSAGSTAFHGGGDNGRGDVVTRENPGGPKPGRPSGGKPPEGPPPPKLPPPAPPEPVDTSGGPPRFNVCGEIAPADIPAAIFEAGPETQCPVPARHRVYMSADDSNSQASPIRMRMMAEWSYLGMLADAIRPQDFLNYADFNYPAVAPGQLGIYPEIMAVKGHPGIYELQVGVQAPRITAGQRKRLNVVFVADVSGSMDGKPASMAKAVMLAVASELRAGDVVSIVSFADGARTALETRPVTGPDDPVLVKAIQDLETAGSTNLDEGLAMGYALARFNNGGQAGASTYRSGLYARRVILISDAHTNTGVLDANIIAQNAADGEGEGVYLIGVQTNPDHNHKLMDKITDLGKGAYIFIDDLSEAKRMFTGRRFEQNLFMAALDVRLNMTLPVGVAVTAFFGEAMSPDPAKVVPQHLGSGDSMVFHQVVATCDGQNLERDDLLEFTVDWRDPHTGVPMVTRGSVPFASLKSCRTRTMVKGRALVMYAEALKRIIQSGDARECSPECAAIHTVLSEIQASLQDNDIADALTTLKKICHDDE